MAAIIGFTMASCGGSGKSSGTYVTEDGMVYSFYQSSDASSEDDRSIDIEGIVFTRK
jgi:hypothetical protein